MSAPNIVRALRLQRAGGEFVLDRPAADYSPPPRPCGTSQAGYDRALGRGPRS
jgi:hypothetical protein